MVRVAIRMECKCALESALYMYLALENKVITEYLNHPRNYSLLPQDISQER